MNESRIKTVFDFSRPVDQQPWKSIDDRIMGGFSESRSECLASDLLHFSGTVSLQNRGGFASVRSPEGQYDLGGCKQLIIRIKGDGQRYKLGVRIDNYFDGVSYLAGFETLKDEWQEVCLPIEAFQPTHHGRQLAEAARLDLSQVKSLGILISDQQEGPFRLDLVWIKAT